MISHQVTWNNTYVQWMNFPIISCNTIWYNLHNAIHNDDIWCYTYIFIYIYIYKYVYIYIYIYLYIHIYLTYIIYIYIFTYLTFIICIYIYIYTHVTYDRPKKLSRNIVVSNWPWHTFPGSSSTRREATWTLQRHAAHGGSVGRVGAGAVSVFLRCPSMGEPQ